MALALGATGYWMYIDVPATPNAVVVCVIIFNAAFGYSWGPIPWLYPPEVCLVWHLGIYQLLTVLGRLCPLPFGQRVFHFRRRRIGRSIGSLER